MRLLQYWGILVKIIICFSTFEHKENVQRLIQFQALDCDKPIKVRHSQLKNICRPKKVTELEETSSRKKGLITLLQLEPNVMLKGYKCVKQHSTFDLFCGAYSHMKLLSPPSIPQKSTVSIEDCQNAYKLDLSKMK